MPKTIKQESTVPNNLQNKINQNFSFIDNLSSSPKLNQSIELCIIKSDFNKLDLSYIKKLQSANKDTEFWISSNNLSRDNIIIANKLGIKNVLSSPFDKKIVEDFFDKKNSKFCSNPNIITNEYDISCISNAKVMIVDDQQTNVELLDETLREFKLNVSTFTKPKEAFQTLLHEKFDLLLLDIMMPGMSGFELAKKIRNESVNQNISIVFISALSDTRNKLKGFDLGSLAYIEKPFDINLIKSQIFNLLKNQRSQEIITESKEGFLATVAHDLKTPINAGINALNLLLNKNMGPLEGMQLELVEDLLSSSRFMKDMVDNVLCKNKMDCTKIKLSKNFHSFTELTEKCIEISKHVITSKEQEVIFKNSCTNALLPFDFIEMQRAVLNLISNASEYSPTKGQIEINIFELENKVGISVQDFGKGIDSKNQDSIFEEYMSYAKKYKKVGTGLGLYITKRIIDAHDGEITLESKIGYGTKITLFLPKTIKE